MEDGFGIFIGCLNFNGGSILNSCDPVGLTVTKEAFLTQNCEGSSYEDENRDWGTSVCLTDALLTVESCNPGTGVTNVDLTHVELPFTLPPTSNPVRGIVFKNGDNLAQKNTKSTAEGPTEPQARPAPPPPPAPTSPGFPLGFGFGDLLPDIPTKKPTMIPTAIPSKTPTNSPTQTPTETPTNKPSTSPIIPGTPTFAPTPLTNEPTKEPTVSTINPTEYPTEMPSESTTTGPTESPNLIGNFAEIVVEDYLTIWPALIGESISAVILFIIIAFLVFYLYCTSQKQKQQMKRAFKIPVLLTVFINTIGVAALMYISIIMQTNPWNLETALKVEIPYHVASFWYVYLRCISTVNVIYLYIHSNIAIQWENSVFNCFFY